MGYSSKWLLAMVLAVAPALAQAELSYVYLGVDMLGSELTEDDGAFGEGADDRSGGLRINAGYRANYWVGVEAALQSLGEFDTGENDVRYGSLSLSAMFYLPLVTRIVEPYARVGGGLMTVEGSFRPDGGFYRRARDTKPMGTAGFGLQFNVHEDVALRIGVDGYAFETRIGGRVNDEGELDRADQVISTGHLGLKVMF